MDKDWLATLIGEENANKPNAVDGMVSYLMDSDLNWNDVEACHDEGNFACVIRYIKGHLIELKHESNAHYFY